MLCAYLFIYELFQPDLEKSEDSKELQFKNSWYQLDIHY